MKIGGFEIKRLGRENLNNLVNRAFMQFLHGGTVTWFGSNPTTYIEKGYSDNEIIFSIVRLLLSKYTQAPFILSAIKPDKESEKSFRKFKAFQAKGGNGTDRALSLLHQTKALEELADHELLTLLQNPNGYQGQAEFIEAAMGYYKLLGETFIYKIAPVDGPNKGKAKELHVLPAHLVEIVYSGDYNDPIRGYKFALGDYSIEIPAEHIMHLKTWNPNYDLQGSQMRGFSPMQAGNKVLTRNHYNKTAQTKAYVNGGSAFLLSSGSESPRGLDQTQIDLVNDRIREKLQGPDNYNNVIGVSGIVNATKIGDSPADLQLMQADENDLKRLCMVFGVDPDIFLSGSTFNNKEYALKSLVSNVILADLIRFRDALNKFLITPEDKLFLDFDTTVYAELQPDLKLMKEIYGDMWQITPNELRSVFQWDSSEQDGMNEIWMPMGLTKMSDSGITEDDFEKAYKRTGDRL